MRLALAPCERAGRSQTHTYIEAEPERLRASGGVAAKTEVLSTEY
jgi:hypothetical protein